MNNKHNNIKEKNRDIKDLVNRLKHAEIWKKDKEDKLQMRMWINSETWKLKMEDISRAKQRFRELENQKNSEIMERQFEWDWINKEQKVKRLEEWEKKMHDTYAY